jgi:hypothetical protein
MAARKVSHLQETQKSDQQAIDRDEEHRLNVEELANSLVFILTNPACPDKLHAAITDALSEIETHTDTVSVDFLRGLFMAPPRQAEGGAA